MKVVLVWPKIEVANCSQRRIERPDESRPPRYRYSLRLAMMAAPEKHPKAIAVPTNAVTRILVDEQEQKQFNKADHKYSMNQLKRSSFFLCKFLAS